MNGSSSSGCCQLNGHREAALPAKVPGLVAPGFRMPFPLSLLSPVTKDGWWLAIQLLRLLVPGTLPTRRRAMTPDTTLNGWLSLLGSSHLIALAGLG
jgi:hypothetical protein